MWRYGRGQESKVSILEAMEAPARTVREALARACETVKRQQLAATDGALLTRRQEDSRWFASCFAPVRATCSRERQRGKVKHLLLPARDGGCQAPAAGSYGRSQCGRGAVIRADSRRASRRFAPPVRANDNGERVWISGR